MSKTVEDTANPESISFSSIKVLNDINIDVKEDEESKKCHQIPLETLNKGKLKYFNPIQVTIWKPYHMSHKKVS